MNDRFNGFILSQSDYREADVMMQVLSKEYGVVLSQRNGMSAANQGAYRALHCPQGDEYRLHRARDRG